MKKLYVIRDIKAGFGVTPGVPAILDMPNDEFAIRVVKGSCAKGQKPNALNVYPEDKELWCVGEFDDLTGVITPCVPRMVCRAIDFISELEVEESEANKSIDPEVKGA